MVRVKDHLKLLIRVLWDFIRGMYVFHFLGPCVTVFGSARLFHDTPEYETARAMGMALGENGFTVMTGGGPGLMEAANRGAREAGGECVACRIRLSFEQGRNNYVDRSVTFRYFFVRKVMLVSHSCALIVLPGGLGTLDELFEVLTLIQTGKIASLPIVFVGKQYWQPLLKVIERMALAGTISQTEMQRVMGLMLVTDEVAEAIAHVKMNAAEPGRSETQRSPGREASSGRYSKSANPSHS
jgi:uncharacterized protein (TIGR00730 family)